MNRWIVAAILFSLGVAVGFYLHWREIRLEYRLFAAYKSTSGSKLRAAAASVRSVSDANIRNATHGVVIIESTRLEHARRLAEDIARKSSGRLAATSLKTIEHPDADGLATGCITGYLAALCWIRFAPRKQKEPAL